MQCSVVQRGKVPSKFEPSKFTWPGQTHPGTQAFPPSSLGNQYEESNSSAFTALPVDHVKSAGINPLSTVSCHQIQF